MTYGAIPYALAVGCAWVALAAARGEERSRITWVIAPLMIFYITEMMLYLVPAILPTEQHGDALIAAYGFANLGSVLAPVGMTYALLNRRVLDIGFALNRVAIFSGVSIVVVGAFMLSRMGDRSVVATTEPHDQSRRWGCRSAAARVFHQVRTRSRRARPRSRVF
jgi:hypothetical protein